VRDNEVIDAELRLLTAIRGCTRSHGGDPSTAHIDALLDERSTQPPRPTEEDGPTGKG
jgi:hypothetical protein